MFVCVYMCTCEYDLNIDMSDNKCKPKNFIIAYLKIVYFFLHFLKFNLILFFNFTILYWFCHISK